MPQPSLIHIPTMYHKLADLPGCSVEMHMTLSEHSDCLILPLPAGIPQFSRWRRSLSRYPPLPERDPPALISDGFGFEHLQRWHRFDVNTAPFHVAWSSRSSQGSSLKVYRSHRFRRNVQSWIHRDEMAAGTCSPENGYCPTIIPSLFLCVPFLTTRCQRAY